MVVPVVRPPPRDRSRLARSGRPLSKSRRASKQLRREAAFVSRPARAVFIVNDLRFAGQVEGFGAATCIFAANSYDSIRAVKARCRRGVGAAKLRFIRASKSKPSDARAQRDELPDGRRGQIGNGRRPARVDDGAVEGGGQKAGAEIPHAVVGQAARVGQHDKRRQVVRQPAERVTDPGTAHGNPGSIKPVFWR